MIQVKATEAFGTPYMTQSTEVELESRLFVTAISGISVSVDDWRGATTEEKAEWQVEIDKLNPNLIECEEMKLIHQINN